ncbi:dihydrolipoyl dehydrogenase [Buchnera aphidicola]|uniref:dihydrolipoyl dehydrogenase n=1 Tax=Buchnera aphidicola TaxID=9 RepID=UPI003463E5A7
MVMDIRTQVLVIGSGPAGYAAAFRSSDLGLKTTLIEKYNSLGGVCLNVGCIPSKFLLHIAKVIQEAKEISKQGVFFKTPKIDLDIIRKKKQEIISTLSSGIKYMAKNRKVQILYGMGSFINKNTVLVVNENEMITVHFDHVIIATGSQSIALPNIPINSEYIWNSTEALSLRFIPRKMLIIGSGIIGLEMATLYSALGSQVDVVDRDNRLLSFLDQDIINIYKKSLSENFNILLQTNINEIIVKNNQILVTLSNTNFDKKEIFYDAVLVAIGRKSNILPLKLENAGVKINSNNFIQVDRQLRTNINNIYAIGDVIGNPLLAHKGIHQGHIAAEVIAGYQHYFEPIVIPAVAYTDPEIAWVGMNENDAIKKNINYEAAVFPWKASGRAIVSNCSHGMTKLIINKDTRKVLGGIIIGRQAGELLSEITLAIEMGCDVEDISLTIHPHPTLSESIGLSAQVFLGTITDLINSKSVFK